jgi:uncharacterized protein YjiS (DUF1127 family)
MFLWHASRDLVLSQLLQSRTCINTNRRNIAVTARKTTLPFPVAAAGASPASLVRRSVAALLAWQTQRRTLAALSRLDDHLLRDVGLMPDHRTGPRD